VRLEHLLSGGGAEMGAGAEARAVRVVDRRLVPVLAGWTYSGGRGVRPGRRAAGHGVP
jgi:hypothetical protein